MSRLLTILLFLFPFILYSQYNICATDSVMSALSRDNIILNTIENNTNRSDVFNPDIIIPVVVNYLPIEGEDPSDFETFRRNATEVTISKVNLIFERGVIRESGAVPNQTDANIRLVLADVDIDGNSGFDGFRIISDINDTYYPDTYLNFMVSDVYPYNFTSVPYDINDGATIKIIRAIWTPYTLQLSETVAHEVGHWLGLEHVFKSKNLLRGYSNRVLSNYENCLHVKFEKDCNLQGDFVCDTKAQYLYAVVPPNGCDIINYGCSGFENDRDLKNIMGYTTNCDYEYFTDGQINRMKQMGIVYRNKVLMKGKELYGDVKLGCTDPNACNFEIYATTDDGTCLFEDIYGRCGGGCTEDSDFDGICDVFDNCIDINGDNICDDDPCGYSNQYISVGGYGTKVHPIGNMCWTDPIKTDKFSNYQSISIAINKEDWKRESEFGPVVTYYTENNDSIGLYNFNTILDDRGICPSGWHVSTDEDWKQLERLIEMEEDEIQRYGSVRSEDYFDFKQVLDDIWGFPISNSKGLKPGMVLMNGTPIGQGKDLYFWTSTLHSNNNAIYRKFDYDNGFIARGHKPNSTKNTSQSGMSIRCVKDVN